MTCFLLINRDQVSVYSQTQLVQKLLIIFNYVVLACILTPLSYIFILYILLLLCVVFRLNKTFVFTFSLIMTEVRLKRRALLLLVFTSNCFRKRSPLMSLKTKSARRNGGSIKK